MKNKFDKKDQEFFKKKTKGSKYETFTNINDD